ncbi:MAG: ABC transporter permease [Oscillospiraceae bacterium]|nr:ABC transporter permease [Oscillospiraceae bacterium]
MGMIKKVFHSPKFRLGFIIFAALLLFVFLYPLFDSGDPLEMIAVQSYLKPGTYVSQYDVAGSDGITLDVVASDKKLASHLPEADRNKMKTYLVDFVGLDANQVDTNNIPKLIEQWMDNYNPNNKAGLLVSAQRDYRNINKEVLAALDAGDIIIAINDPETGELIQNKTIHDQQYVQVSSVANRQVFPLGGDNFGRNVLRELVEATKTSLMIGLIAGIVATAIGLTLGLIAGYVGGTTDNIITFITNLFTVIPSFVILILISYSVGQEARGVLLVACIIGFTAWPWTCRSVRSQVISLRNRDHVNLMKLSGHGLLHILTTGILPYIASYVVMALILQIAQGILSEAQLSMLGLGAATSKTATLGLMMNWATLFSAVVNGSWWAYFPVVIVIALMSFSMNLMNTGLDQVFNPQLRD